MKLAKNFLKHNFYVLEYQNLFVWSVINIYVVYCGIIQKYENKCIFEINTEVKYK